MELFYGASTATSTSQLTGIASSITAVGWNGVTAPAPLGTAFGSYAGSGVFNAGNALVPGTPGSTYAFAIFAHGTLGASTYTGWSAIFDGASQLNNIATVPNLPSGLYQGSFTVSSVPEPTTMALGGFGLAALLVARRKRYICGLVDFWFFTEPLFGAALFPW